MTLLLCDKCGKEMRREGAFVVQIGDYMYHRTTESLQFELCSECTDKLRAFLVHQEKQA